MWKLRKNSQSLDSKNSCLLPIVQVFCVHVQVESTFTLNHVTLFVEKRDHCYAIKCVLLHSSWHLLLVTFFA